VGSRNWRGVEGHALNLVGELNLHGATRTTREGTEKEPRQGPAISALVQCVGRRYLFREVGSQEGTWSVAYKCRPVLVERGTERQAYRLGPHSGAAGIKPGRQFLEPAGLWLLPALMLIAGAWLLALASGGWL
jgi:hypothetical protein